jgi:hypothetical protein
MDCPLEEPRVRCGCMACRPDQSESASASTSLAAIILSTMKEPINAASIRFETHTWVYFAHCAQSSG